MMRSGIWPSLENSYQCQSQRLLFKRFWDSGRSFDDAEALAVMESYLSYGDDSAT